MRAHVYDDCGGQPLDQLVTRALGDLYGDQDAPVGSPPGNPDAYLVLARATVDRHGGTGRTTRREAAVQHLFAAVWQYLRFFRPGSGWRLLDCDPVHAQLRWRHREAGGVGDVDVICAGGHPDTAACPAPRPRW